ncbi:cystatin-B isoform X1 [Halichoerus grypus]
MRNVRRLLCEPRLGRGSGLFPAAWGRRALPFLTAPAFPGLGNASLVCGVLNVKAQLEEQENKKYATFKAVEFRSQVVAGMNYFIKVQVDDDEFVHLRVFRSLPHENKPVALSSYQTNKARHDELAYF